MSMSKEIRPWRNEFASTWEKLKGGVGRPTTGEVDRMEQLAEARFVSGDANVAILGATPELRSLLARRDQPVHLIDASPEMVEAMTELVPTEPSPRETVVLGNWLDDRLFPSDRFDVIFGDLVLSNLTFADHDRFLANIRKWLKPGGMFVSRIESFKPTHRSFTYDELFDLVSHPPLTPRSSVALWDGAWLVGPTQTRPIQVRDFYDGMVRRLAERPRPVVQTLLDQGGTLFPLEKVWYSHAEPELLDLLGRHFVIEAVTHDPTLPAVYRDFPRIYALAKR